MNELIQSLNEVSVALHRASGLSLSLSKAAFGMEAITRENGLREKLKSVQPSSEAQATELREAGAKLHNICARGPGNDVALLKLRLLACEAVRGPPGFAAGSEPGERESRTLDVMRSFSKTGLLLMGVSESTLAIQALETCLELVSTITNGGNAVIEMIRMVYGDTQEAHDCGHAYFGALCGLMELYFDTLNDNGAKQREWMLARMLDILRANTSFIAHVRPKNQQVLRSILESGMDHLDLQESIPYQKWMFDEWERFTSSTPGLQQAIAARLAFALAKTNDSAGSIAALERAETVAGLTFKEIKDNTQFVLLARCAVANAQLCNEIRMQKLAGQQQQTTALQQACMICFAELVQDFSLETATQENKDLVLNCAADLCRVVVEGEDDKSCHVEVFDASYGKLLEKTDNVDLLCEVVQHAFTQSGGPNWVFASNRVMNEILRGRIATASAGRKTKTQLTRSIWNELCNAHTKSNWDMVFACAELANELSTLDVEMQARCLQARSMASLQIHLPDRDGDEAKELAVLQQCVGDAVRSAELSQDTNRKSSAAVLQLKCLIRISVLLNTKDDNGAVISKTCRTHLQAGLLPCEAILQLASEAEAVNASACALQILVLARDHIISQNSNMQGLAALTRRIVELRLPMGEVCEASKDVEVYADYAKMHNNDDDDVGFKSWAKSALLKLCSSNKSVTMEDALETASLLKAASKVCMDQDQAQDLLCASAGELVACAVKHVLGSTSSAVHDPLTALCGEQANAAISELTAARKLNDAKCVPLLLFATMLMTCTLGKECDEIVAERIKSICESGEFPSPQMEEMEQVAAVARKLSFARTARELLLRIVSLELRSPDPDNNHIITSITRMIQDSTANDEIADWMEQVESLRSSSGAINPVVLEMCALACWRKKRTLGAGGVKLVLLWLQCASEGNDLVGARRAVELKEIKEFMRTTQPPPQEQEDDRDTVDDDEN